MMFPNTRIRRRPLREALVGFARGSIFAGIVLGYAAVYTTAYSSVAEVRSSVDMPGPLLAGEQVNESVRLYNEAVRHYKADNWEQALETMRAAMRAREFGHPGIGLAYSNLCLMYLRVGRFANAEAACTKALAVLPNYVPATLNLSRAERRERPE